jgi:hypothetical protein
MAAAAAPAGGFGLAMNPPGGRIGAAARPRGEKVFRGIAPQLRS